MTFKKGDTVHVVDGYMKSAAKYIRCNKCSGRLGVISLVIVDDVLAVSFLEPLDHCPRTSCIFGINALEKHATRIEWRLLTIYPEDDI